MREVLSVLIAEPVRIVAEDIAAEVLGVHEDALVTQISPSDTRSLPKVDLLFWGWGLDTAELLDSFRSIAAAARHVVVTTSVEKMNWDFEVDYLPFPARPERLRETIGKALGNV